MPTRKKMGGIRICFSTLITAMETSCSYLLGWGLLYVANNTCKHRDRWYTILVSLGVTMNIWINGYLQLIRRLKALMSSVYAPSSAEANSAYLHLSIGVSAEKKGETPSGCSGDRWKGNVWIRIKQRRKRRPGGEEEGEEKRETGTEMRFMLVAGLWDDFPYQQARETEWANMIFSSTQPTENRQRGSGVRWQEKGKRGEKTRKMKVMSKWKKDGEMGEGQRSDRG